MQPLIEVLDAFLNFFSYRQYSCNKNSEHYFFKSFKTIHYFKNLVILRLYGNRARIGLHFNILKLFDHTPNKRKF